MLRVIFFSLLIGFASKLMADPVNINTANAEELAENLVGVGPVKAQAIIDYRETNGPFFKPEEITNVKGIGLKTLEKNLDDILVRD